MTLEKKHYAGFAGTQASLQVRKRRLRSAAYYLLPTIYDLLPTTGNQLAGTE